jgi:DNA-binding transcriptional ArsR family regulator
MKNALSDILSSRVRAEIFRLLFSVSDKELHVREIERQAGLAMGTVRQDLTKLTRLGLVKTRRDGNRLHYRANREHPLYEEIRGLVLKTVGLVAVLQKALGTKDIRAAFVFGSLASGKEEAHSDVDVMVVGDLGLRELSRRLAGISDRLGREVNPHVLHPADFRKRRESSDHFITSVLESAKIFVVGTEDDLARLG